jgi:hypothetical protein
MMCGHVFMYYNRDHVQRHRPVWQCGTCGRVSSVPLDCCTRPDGARHHPAGLTHLLGQWVSGLRHWTRASMRPRWWWQRHPATRAGTTPATASPHSVGSAGVKITTADSDESPERDEVVMVAGAHQ